VLRTPYKRNRIVVRNLVTWLAPRLKGRVFELAAAAVAVLGLVSGWAAGSWLLAVLSLVLPAGALALRVAWRRRQATGAPAQEESPAVSVRATTRRTAVGGEESSDDLIEEMLEHGRFALLLRPQIVGNLNEGQVQRAVESLDKLMALTPEGTVLLHTWRAAAELDGDGENDEHLVRVEAFYLDRYPVTNGEYQRFVDAGGYEQMSLWDPDVWSAVLDFVDRTGEPGPAFWERGRCLRGKGDHPVVGVCWYEAAAYARWVGKRLPTDAEWVKAAAWPVGAGRKPLQRKYPWGEAMNHHFANVWGSNHGDTIPVQQCQHGASVGGAYHLIGNVWEWTHSNFGAWDEAAKRIEVNGVMKSLRGGAYDTYFDGQASCQFQSGDSAIARKHNIGFRCALGLCDLAPNFSPEWTAQDEQEQAEVSDRETGALEAAV
jgi:iron(II)-dependent oxidoreductase